MAGAMLPALRYGRGMDYVIANFDRIAAMTGRHLYICALSISLALVVGIPLGILASKVRRAAAPILNSVSIIYTIPTLALFGLMIPILGIGLIPAVAAVALYSLLPVIQNTYTGIVTVRPEIREAARGIGMGEGQILLRVELPLAARVIFAGLRTAIVNAVGMATLASLIGAGGLGDLIFRGIASVSLNVVLAGSVPVIMLAIIADLLLRFIEQHLASQAEGKVEPAP